MLDFQNKIKAKKSKIFKISERIDWNFNINRRREEDINSRRLSSTNEITSHETRGKVPQESQKENKK